MRNKLVALALIFAASLLGGCGLSSYDTHYVMPDISVIPQPLKMETTTDHFIFRHDTRILIPPNNPEIRRLANYFDAEVSKAARLDFVILDVPSNEMKNVFVIKKNYNSKLGREGYKITVTPDRIELEASQMPGLFYGIQTILQLLPVEIYNVEKTAGIRWQVPCMTLEDMPRFDYRSVRLDVAETFFPKEDLFQFINLLGMHKINVLHLKLTDTKHWRYESIVYPELNGAKDSSNLYFKQSEIVEIIRYAAERSVRIVPEIDFSLPRNLIVKQHPDFMCKVVTDTLPVPQSLCPGNQEAMDYMYKLSFELAGLFPSEYVHVGGQHLHEVGNANCSACAALMAAKKLQTEGELQEYFVSEVCKPFAKKNRKVLIDNNNAQLLLPDNVVSVVRGKTDNGIAMAKKERAVVFAPEANMFFHYYQGLKEVEPLAEGGYIDLSKAYELSLPGKTHSPTIMGVEAIVDTKHLKTVEEVEYMLLPRLNALSEAGWTETKHRDWPDFELRMIRQYRRYINAKLKFYVPTPVALSTGYSFADTAHVVMDNSLGCGKIYYTVNGLPPTKASNPYYGPFNVSKDAVVRVRAFTPVGIGGNYLESYYFKETKTADNPYLHGLKYMYYPKNYANSLAKLSTAHALREGILYYLNINTTKPADYDYTFVFEGFVKIEKAGKYTFYTTSASRSQLYLNHQLAVDNPGGGLLHEEAGSITLEAGMIPLRFIYCEAVRGQSIGLLMEGNGMEKQPISPTMLYRE